MKLSKVAIFTVLSGSMFFAAVGAAHADDEQPVPELYSSVVCDDGSTPVTDASGVDVCPTLMTVSSTMDVTCIDGSTAPSAEACPTDGTTMVTSDVGWCAVAPVSGDSFGDGCGCPTVSGDAEATPCVAYDSIASDSTLPRMDLVRSTSSLAPSVKDSNIWIPLAGLIFVLALTFGARRLTK